MTQINPSISAPRVQHFVSDATLTMCAEHQAKVALRAGRIGDSQGYARAQNAMFDTLERCQYPRLAVRELIRAVGRSRAMVLRIDRTLVNLALDHHRFEVAAQLGAHRVDAVINLFPQISRHQAVEMALAA